MVPAGSGTSLHELPAVGRPPEAERAHAGPLHSSRAGLGNSERSHSQEPPDPPRSIHGAGSLQRTVASAGPAVDYKTPIPAPDLPLSHSELLRWHPAWRKGERHAGDRFHSAEAFAQTFDRQHVHSRPRRYEPAMPAGKNSTRAMMISPSLARQ